MQQTSGFEYPMRAIDKWVKVVALAVAVSGAMPLIGADIGGFGAAVAQTATVSGVTVTGNTRVETETILSYLVFKNGRSASAADIDASIRALFDTGLFSDVRISRGGAGLLVAVEENPVIARVAFQGNDKHSDEILAATIELQSRSVLTQAKLQSDTQKIQELYRRTGRYNATVTPETVDLGQKRVDLIFKIDEGPRTEVNRIAFVGNKAFSEWRLADVISTKESGLFGWIKSSDNYDPDKLNADQELLKNFYYNHGYADFRVISATADFDREQDAFFITFTVEEGEAYKFGDINVETTLSEVDPADLKAAVYTSKGSTYSARDVQKSLEALTVKVAEKGYAFVQVRPRGDRDYANKTISVTYFIDEGARAYIERINIIGNTRTRDYVIRREFDLGEGDAYNQVMVEQAERRLRNLGYFKSVRIWSEAGSSPDRVIVNVQVEDQTTGEISVGAGYSTNGGIIAELSVSERNFLGRGQFVRASVSRGVDLDGKSSTENYEVSFTEPYLFDRRLAGGFDIYRRSLGAGSDVIHPYSELLTGGNVRLGIPVMDDLTFNVAVGAVQQEISGVGAKYSGFVKNGDVLKAFVNYSLVYDTIDNKQFPRDGIFASLAQEYTGLGGDINSLKTTLRADYYKELFTDEGVVGHVGLKAGHVMGLGEDLRVIDHFRPGGDIIRGFAAEGLGPRDAATGYAGTLETVFPMPAIPQEFGLFGSLFADAGTVFDVDTGSLPPGTTILGDNGAIRASVGVGVLWQSPFGLLRADFAYPVLKEASDETQVFRFSGGTRF
jgi:outer membrane protein insertion porin family